MRSQNTKMKAIYSLIVLWTLVWHVQLCHAVREGTANAKVMIQRYEREKGFAKAALWHEAAADCLKIISIPMTEIQIRYYLHHRKNARTERSRGELADIKKRREYHLKAAKTRWEKSETEGTSPELEAEREKISQFISMWAQIYPNQFYRYGIYPSFFKVEQEIFKRRGDYGSALYLEADAAEMCADQYNEITVAYFRRVALNHEAIGGAAGGVGREATSRRAANHLKYPETHHTVLGSMSLEPTDNTLGILDENRVTQYENVRDAHRRRAALLRKLAEGKPKTSPIEAESALRDLSRQSISPAPKLTSTQALKIANRDARLQEHLKAHRGVHGYASFQGFAWFVSYHNHGWGNLGIALVDDETGTVLDILNWLMPKESTKR